MHFKDVHFSRTSTIKVLYMQMDERKESVYSTCVWIIDQFHSLARPTRARGNNLPARGAKKIPLGPSEVE